MIVFEDKDLTHAAREHVFIQYSMKYDILFRLNYYLSKLILLILDASFPEQGVVSLFAE